VGNKRGREEDEEQERPFDLVLQYIGNESRKVHRPALSYCILGPPLISMCQHVEDFSRGDLISSIIIRIIT
jgi:hypothetical protein